MRPVAELSPASCRRLRGIFCDIDDTLTWEGELVPEALDALFAARDAGLRVVPITGRPAGWVDHIARMWPVDGVVGENGGLWFYLEDGQMQRRFQQSKAARKANRERLTELGQLILQRFEFGLSFFQCPLGLLQGILPKFPFFSLFSA